MAGQDDSFWYEGGMSVLLERGQVSPSSSSLVFPMDKSVCSASQKLAFGLSEDGDDKSRLSA